MYDLPDFFLVDNAIDRYSIGDRTPGLAYAADGSLTITMSPRPRGPGHARQLAARPRIFRPILRLYRPDDAVFDGRYVLPPISGSDAPSMSWAADGQQVDRQSRRSRRSATRSARRPGGRWQRQQDRRGEPCQVEHRHSEARGTAAPHLPGGRARGAGQSERPIAPRGEPGAPTRQGRPCRWATIAPVVHTAA
jgi:hypothetical protein